VERVPVTWPDDIDEVLAGDLTAALAYVTPAGGVVVTPVSPFGLRDRDAGTVTFTTSLGFGRKLDRLEREPRIALAFHAREHGFSDSPLYVLVQGRAEIRREPDREWLLNVLYRQSERFVGARRTGFFWDRWLREYYDVRVPVEVAVERVVAWPDLHCSGEPRVVGPELPADEPPAQSAPRGGTGPRVDVGPAARRLRALPHVLIGYRGADGHPVVLPATVGGEGERGIGVEAGGLGLPPAGRRAGLLGHRYGPQLTAIELRQHTGWLSVDDAAVYAPHTEQGFKAPANKTVLLLAQGLLAKRGVRKARAAG
jgi:hypothetical protein